MKLSAPQSVKFLKLKRRLNYPHWQVVGLLESLWMFTQMNAPHGDIGKHSNEDIAAGMEWAGDHEKLIRDLTETGWLDPCPVHRILIHDWEDHCPNFLKGNMANKGEVLAKIGEPIQRTKSDTKCGTRSGTRSTTKSPDQVPDLAKVILSKPIQAYPTLPETGDAEEPAKEKKARKRNPLFDALAEVTGLDPITAGSSIGKVVKNLNAAEPPYTTEDVQTFYRRFHELCPHAARDRRGRPTVNEVEKYIGLIRSKPPQAIHRPPQDKIEDFGEPVF